MLIELVNNYEINKNYFVHVCTNKHYRYTIEKLLGIFCLFIRHFACYLQKD